MASSQRDLVRTVLAVLFLGGLIVVCFWILKPFLVPAIWAAMIVITTWPMLLRLQALLWGRRSLAVLAMVLIVLLVVVVPLTLTITTIALNTDEIVDRVRSMVDFRFPTPPAWLVGLPIVGQKAAVAWQQVAAAGIDGLLAKLTPYAGNATRWFIARAGSVGFVFLEFLLTLIVAAIMYARGEDAATALRRFGRRLAGDHGENSVLLAGQAIRGVALGVGVTAVVQSVLGGIGLGMAGVPFAGLLTALMFVLCLAQVGPSLVLFPAVIWVYWSGESGWGTFLLVWSLIVSTVDNFLRPMLIKLGADLPLLLIFAGVIGGLFAFGLVGIFVGPVVLAVGYTLLEAWVEQRDDAAAKQ
jgi:predicted PurR-regulated permease PerM